MIFWHYLVTNIMCARAIHLSLLTLPASRVENITRDFLTCYCCSYYSSMLKHNVVKKQFCCKVYRLYFLRCFYQIANIIKTIFYLLQIARITVLPFWCVKMRLSQLTAVNLGNRISWESHFYLLMENCLWSSDERSIYLCLELRVAVRLYNRVNFVILYDDLK